MERCGLYIHIPFCEQKCLYCDFCSQIGDDNVMSRYIDAVIEESTRYKDFGVFDTVFVGGGTPTVLPTGEMTRLFEGLSKNLDIRPIEFTIEGNPNSYDVEKATEYSKLGVTRASVGVQSFNDDLLTAVGRIHNAQHAITCLRMLKSQGFDISCDLMVGLPNQTIDDVKYSVNTALDMGVEHISCYGLILEEGTPLFDMVQCGKIVLPTADEAADMYDVAMEIITQKGLSRYEISNFGKPCQHNIGYWNLKPYLGLGVSAHSYKDNCRWYNTHDLASYCNGSTSIQEETLTDKDKAVELLILGLRMEYGVDLERVKAWLDKSEQDKLQAILSNDREYYTICDGILKIKSQYMTVENQLLYKFLDI